MMADPLDPAADSADPSAAMQPEGSATSGSLDWGIIGGIVLGFGSLLAGMLLEGMSPMAYMILSAGIIVIGGTLGATLTSVGIPVFKRIPSFLMRALRYEPINRPKAIQTLVRFAEKARREGLLVLEDDLQNADDEFLRKGVQLVVDGTDPELVREILQTEVDAVDEEWQQASLTFTAAGGYSPTLGIIGTVMGLVNVLANLSNAAALGPAIAVAFVATFYGVSLANLVYLPLGTKIAGCAADEAAGRELMIEGILAIQSGDNPRIVEEKLVAFLNSQTKLEFEAAKKAPDTGAGANDPANLDLAA